MSKGDAAPAALQGINARLSAIAGLVGQRPEVPSELAATCQVGVDLGTADIQTIAVAADGEPVAAMLDWADVVRDGVVVDYARACSIVREQLSAMERCLGCAVTEVVTSFPPGTDSRLSTHVVESAGVQVKYVIDEPSSVAALLDIDNGAVVDIGGGTTGTAIVRHGQVMSVNIML